MKGLLAGVLVLLMGLWASAPAADWPQWRGPGRDGKSSEVGLLKRWPAEGPKLLWSVEGLGKGYASLSISRGAVYTTGMIDGEGFLFAYGLKGQLKWKESYGPEWTGDLPGARSTPVVDGERVYVISGMGLVACFNTADGKQKWTVDMFKKFGGRNIKWGIYESPLIVDNKIICTPGGPNVSLAALNKMTGETVWTARGPNEKSAYCSPILIKRGQRQLIVTMLKKSMVAVDANSGTLIWRIPHKRTTLDITTVSPLYDKGRLYVTNGYGEGGSMYEISSDGRSYEKKWTDKVLGCHHGAVVLVNGHIYGSNSKGKFICLELASGKVTCQDKAIGKSSTIYADGLLYCYSEEQGTVRLLEPGISAVPVVSSFKVQQGSGEHWAHPAISDGRLYIRHGEALMVYDIGGASSGAFIRRTQDNGC